jgi:hypothetical protein
MSERRRNRRTAQSRLRAVAAFRSLVEVIDVAQILGEEIRPSLKCARVKPDGLDDLKIPAALGVPAHRHSAAKLGFSGLQTT